MTQTSMYTLVLTTAENSGMIAYKSPIISNKACHLSNNSTCLFWVIVLSFYCVIIDIINKSITINDIKNTFITKNDTKNFFVQDEANTLAIVVSASTPSSKIRSRKKTHDYNYLNSICTTIVVGTTVCGYVFQFGNLPPPLFQSNGCGCVPISVFAKTIKIK
ncbi:MAG: hypothetical protein LBU22_10475 [Dysgonamonadaceae bacterium]|jgi:hypothetical protein|nr:hypothetical protein [Dysgonamonadaceae bacterium]